MGSDKEFGFYLNCKCSPLILCKDTTEAYLHFKKLSCCPVERVEAKDRLRCPTSTLGEKWCPIDMAVAEVGRRR